MPLAFLSPKEKSIFERERLNLVSKTLYDFMFIRWSLSFALSFRSVTRNTTETRPLDGLAVQVDFVRVERKKTARYGRSA